MAQQPARVHQPQPQPPQVPPQAQPQPTASQIHPGIPMNAFAHMPAANLQPFLLQSGGQQQPHAPAPTPSPSPGPVVHQQRLPPAQPPAARPSPPPSTASTPTAVPNLQGALAGQNPTQAARILQNLGLPGAGLDAALGSAQSDIAEVQQMLLPPGETDGGPPVHFNVKKELETSVIPGAELTKENQHLTAATRAALKPTHTGSQVRNIPGTYGQPGSGVGPKIHETHPWLHGVIQAKLTQEHMTMQPSCYDVLSHALTLQEGKIRDHVDRANEKRNNSRAQMTWNTAVDIAQKAPSPQQYLARGLAVVWEADVRTKLRQEEAAMIAQRKREDFETKRRLAEEFAKLDEERRNRKRGKSGGGDGDTVWWDQPRSEMDMFALAEFRQKFDIAKEFEQGPALSTRKRKKAQSEDQASSYADQLAVQAQQLEMELVALAENTTRDSWSSQAPFPRQSSRCVVADVMEALLNPRVTRHRGLLNKLRRKCFSSRYQPLISGTKQS